MDPLENDRTTMEIVILCGESPCSSGALIFPTTPSVWQLHRSLVSHSEAAYRLLQTHLWLGADLLSSLTRVNKSEFASWPKSDEEDGSRSQHSSLAAVSCAFYGTMDVTGYTDDIDAVLLLLQELSRVVPGCRARATLYDLCYTPNPGSAENRTPMHVTFCEDAIASICVGGILSGVLKLDHPSPSQEQNSPQHRNVGHRRGRASKLRPRTRKGQGKLLEEEFQHSYWFVNGEVHKENDAQHRDGCERAEEAAPPSLERFIANASTAKLVPPLLLDPQAEPRLTYALAQHMALWVETGGLAVQNLTLMVPPSLGLALHTLFGDDDTQRGVFDRPSARDRVGLLHEIINFHALEEPLVWLPGATKPPGTFAQRKPKVVQVNGKPVLAPPESPPFVIPGNTHGLSAEEQLLTAIRESEQLSGVYEGFDSLLKSGRYVRARIPIIHCVALGRLLHGSGSQTVLFDELMSATRRAGDVRSSTPVCKEASPLSAAINDDHPEASVAVGQRRQPAATVSEIMLGIAFMWAFERWIANCRRVLQGERRHPHAAAIVAAYQRVRQARTVAEGVLKGCLPDDMTDTEKVVSAYAEIEARLLAPFPPTYSLGVTETVDEEE